MRSVSGAASAAFSPGWAPALTRVGSSPPAKTPLHVHVPRAPPLAARVRPVPMRLSAATGTGAGAVPEKAPSGGISFRAFGRPWELNARLALLAVPLLWGSLPPIYKLRGLLPWAVSAAAFNALRLLLSFLCVAPAAVDDLRSRKPDTRRLLAAGAELGFWTFMASTGQMLAVRYTSASRSAFLVQLQTVLVPVLAYASGDRSALNGRTLAASMLALAGVACLTLDSAAAPLTWAGDGTMLIVACIAAMLVLRTRQVAVSLRSAPLVAYKVMFQFLFAALFMAVSGAYFAFTAPAATTAAAAAGVSFWSGVTPHMIILNVLLVVWSGVCVSAGSTWLHIKANTVVNATESAVIFSFTPLWASVFAIGLGERFGIRGAAGAALIVLSTVLCSAPTRKKQLS